MKYKGFTLDPFQEEAVNAIIEGKSVVVSAATGTGKTLIADYAVKFYLEKGKKIIYTSPIKSLSNQKFREFKEHFGDDQVGLLTGDIVINPRAPLTIMTVEIYRNMLLTSDPVIDDIACVVFDEIHYINDRDRGIIWEESIIFSPERIRIVALSATIPNSEEFANWIKSIKKHPIKVVKNSERAVPLEHLFFETHNGLLNYNQYSKKLKKYKSAIFRKKINPKDYFKKYDSYSFIDLVEELRDKDRIPLLFFVFSRKKTEQLATELINNLKFDIKAKEISNFIDMELVGNEDIYKLETTTKLISALKKGVAFHHAGLLPVLKEMVEKLFSKGLLKVLFATETFAVGINMPARSVAFEALRKYDGINFRYLKTKEFYQMAGRAGRRGIDKEGFVIPIVNYQTINFNYIKELMQGDVEPIRSQFKLSYNTVVNLSRQFTPRDSITILKKSFFQYQSKKKKAKIPNLFYKRLKVLKKNNYITESGNLTEKGYFLTKIYTESLIVSELFTDENIMDFSPFEWFFILTMIIYEPGRSDKFYYKDNGKYILEKFNKESFLYSYFLNKDGFMLEPFLKEWFEERSTFVELMQSTNIQEGTIIRLLRMTIDLIFQIKNATNREEIIERCRYIVYKIEREYIKFEV